MLLFCPSSSPRINYHINRYRAWWIIALLTVFCAQLSAQSLPPDFSSNEVQTGYTTPIALLFSTDGRQFFVWDKSGRVFVSNWNGSTYVRQDQPVIDISEEVGNWGDAGFLSMCFDPDFSSNGLVYLFYVVDRYHLFNAGKPTYDKNASEINNATISRVTRYRLINTGGTLTADASSRKILIGETKTTGIPLTYPTHMGGTLMFGRDGTLLVSTGDNGYYGDRDSGSNPVTYFDQALRDTILREAENVGAYRAQLVGSLCGKVLRINPNTGDGVSSNPFYDAANPRAARSRVWALGLRNAYRMAMQPGTGSTNPADGNPGTLLIGDVGWNTAEEIDVIDQAGLNFGWPLYEGMNTTPSYYGQDIRNLDEPGQPTFMSLCLQPTSAAVDSDKTKRRFTHTRPALDWLHDAHIARVPTFDGNTASSRIIGTAGAPAGTPFHGNAAIGGAFYTQSRFPATYLNSYFFTDFGQNWIKNITLQGNAVSEVRDFASDGFGQNIVSLAVNPLDGSLFYVSTNGQIVRISYGGNQPPVARPSADVTSGTSSLTVHFSGASSTDPEGRPLQFRWDFGDGTSSTETNPTHTFSSPDERSFTVTLTVTDEGQLAHTSPITISINGTPPTVRITSPTNGTLYPLDRASLYTLTADVTGTNLSYEWQVALLHNTHEHPEPVLTTVSPQIQISPVGCSGSEAYSYRVSLKVTNRSGQSATTSVRLYPDCQSASGAVRQVTATPGPNTIRVDWQNPSVTFDEVMVAVRATSGFSDNPNGTDYSADADFTGSGTAFDGGRVVYRGRNQTVSILNLTAGTVYYVRVYTRIGTTWNGGVEVSATPLPPPSTAGPLTLVSPTYTCTTGALTFQTTGGNGTPIEYASPGITDWTTNPNQVVGAGLRSDPKIIVLNARQSGIAISYNFDLAAACGSSSTNHPPVQNSPIGNQTATVQQSFNFVIPGGTFTDPDNQPLTYTMSGLPPGLRFDAPSASLTGTPTTAGQSTVTLTATDPANLSASTQFLLTVSNASAPPPTPPSGSFAISGITTVQCVSVNATRRQLSFTPQYTGLTGQPVSVSVVNEMLPTILGGPYVLNLYIDNPVITVKARQMGTAGEVSFTYGWLAACTPGNPPPPVSQPPTTLPLSQPPVSTRSIPEQRAMVGQPFGFVVPGGTFTDPDNQPLTYTMSGLPPGLRFDAPSASLTGTPTTAGQSTVTLTATDPTNLSASIQFLLTVSSPPYTGSFAISGVTTVQCLTLSAGQRQLSFTPQYAGLNGQPVSVSVVGEMLPTSLPGPYTLRIYTDNPVITVKAQQTGTAGEASYTYGWLAACSPGNGAPSQSAASSPVVNQPPPSTVSFAITGVTTVQCGPLGANQRQVTFTPQYDGLNGQPVSVSVVGEMLPTSLPGPYTLRLYIDNPTITVKARQMGTAGEVSFAYGWLNACRAGGGRLNNGSMEPMTVRVLGNPILTETVGVEIRGASEDWLKLQIIDAHGRRLNEAIVPQPTSVVRSTLKLPGPAGMYLLHVSTSTQHQVLKLIKQ